MKKPFLIFLFTVSVAFCVTAQTQNNFEISKNLDIYASLLRELNLNYVDEIDPSSLNKTAIETMLNGLDPYTVFIPESQVEDFQLMTTGEYGGIGSLIQQIGDYVVITEPYEGYPAQKSGLIAGDQLMEINGISMKGKNSQEVSDLLKGQPGTPIDITYGREGAAAPVKMTLTREKIKIDNIPYQTVFDNKIGYIRLSGFTQKAASEMKNVFLDMKSKYTLTGLIIDLRGNGGGLLNEAVDITNLVVNKGELVVTTRGKSADRTTVHRTRMLPVDTDIPLVVLVNENSASASEILAGALQDFDRAVIVGQRTYGKGLVQNVVPLVYNTQLKITVAKYYIPSGRCIQAIDYSDNKDNVNGSRIADSLISSFKTRHGRIVYDGGGITPDVILEPYQYSAVSSNLYTSNLIFRFANNYAAMHKSIAPADVFSISDSTYQAFVNFAESNNFSYQTESEEIIQALREIAENEKYLDAVEPKISELEKGLIEYKKQDIYKHRSEIEEMLKIEIVSRYYYQTGKIVASLKNDPELKKAIGVLNDQPVYKKLLTP
ncbi:MAG: PDZ domain-containing protein [Bacteroidetes bacterium]|nr:PDZ domain-containing protein [Bacteroidota bacterium]